MCDLLLSTHLQSKELKRYKDNQKEEEKLALKTVEVSVPKSEKKRALNEAKADLLTKRQLKVHMNGMIEIVESISKKKLHLHCETIALCFPSGSGVFSETGQRNGGRVEEDTR